MRAVAAGWIAVGVATAGAQDLVSVVPDHKDGVYAVGQPIHWTVSASPTSHVVSLHYTLKAGQTKPVGQGTLTLTNGTGVVEGVLQEPGTLLAEFTYSEATGRKTALGGAIVAPAQIKPSAPRPDDFDAFWAAKIEELTQVPANPKLEAVDVGQPAIDYWKLSMDNIRGTHIQGQLARPKKGGKLPAMLIVQWAGVYPLKREWVTERAKDGWLALNIIAHDLPIDQPDAFYKELSNGPLKDYTAIGNVDRETSYFLRMYLSCYRAAEYLSTRDDWDGRTLVVTGGSQGGLQSIMVAGLHPKITAVLADVPAGCDMTGPEVGREPGWPKWYVKVGTNDAAKVHNACRYYDVVNFASRITCPVLVGVGLIDQTCPAAGVLAAVNQVKGPREVVFLPRAAHQEKQGSHAAYHARYGAWTAALRQDKPAPVKGP